MRFFISIFLILLFTNLKASSKDSTAKGYTFSSIVSTISASPTSQCLKDNSYTFTSGSTISSGSITTYFWKFGDGNTSSGTTATHSYATAGTFNVTLIVTSDNGCIDSVIHSVTVFPQPKAIFIAPAAQCLTANNFSFNSTSTISSGTIASQTWNFGDGNTSTGISSTHSYAASGGYNVSLVVTSDNGCIDSVAQLIDINPKPSATFTAPASQCLNANSFNFNSTATISSGTITTQTWNFGDGNSATGATATHSYAAAGTYNVTLVVSSNNGCIDSITHTISISPKPVADFTAPSAQCLTGNNYNFISTATISSGTIGTQTWNFGDGNSATGATVSHTYADEGSYEVTLIVSSDNGCSDSIKHTIIVYPKPKAIFTDPIAQCLFGNKFNFNSNSIINSGSISSYFWNFGDGNKATVSAVAHSYLNAGNYTVSLKIGSEFGCSDSMQQIVSIHPNPHASFSDPPPQCLNGNNFNFINNASNSTGIIATSSWNFGDGNSGLGITSSHSYSTSGNYLVQLIAISDYGCADSTTKSVTIYPQPISNFVAPADQFLINNQFNFQSNASINTGSINSLLWFFGDGNSASGINVTHSYLNAGTFPVTLIAGSNFGCYDSINKNIKVINQITTTSFVVPQAQCLVGNNFNFVSKANVSAGSIISQIWNFGDGSSSAGLNVFHSYALPGSYLVKLIITTNMGIIDTASNLITVYPQPIANFIAPAEQWLAGNSFNFQSNASLSNGILNNFWDLGDGNTESGINITHNYLKPGTFPVTLIAISNVGCRDSIRKDIVVNVQSSASIFVTPSAHCLKDNLFSFKSDAQVNNGLIISNAWDFGDGSTGSGFNVIHSYRAPGTYYVKLIITTNIGLKDSVVHSITVYAQPTASFIAPQEQFLNINNFNFTNQSTIITGQIINQLWNFGDGSVTTSYNATHTYNSAGTFSVNLSVVSNNGCVDSITKPVIVNKQSTAAIFVTPDAHCLTGNLFSFISNAQVSSGSIISHQWDFGDGKSGTGATILHSYSSAGIYYVKLTTKTNTGLQDSVMHTITVFPQPTISFIVPADQFLNGNNFNFISNASVTTGFITSVSWSFGDGFMATGNQVSHAYASVGKYPVTVFATTDKGCIDSSINTVFVNTQSVSAIFNTPAAQCLTGNLFSFTSNATVSAGSIISHQWDFGDGTNGTGVQVQHRYSNAGTYRVKLVTTTNVGLTDSVIHTIIVHPQPVADIVMLPNAQCLSGNKFSFTGKVSVNNVSINSFTWKINDSTTLNGTSINQTFTDAGNHNIKLTAKSFAGCLDSVVKTISVFQEPIVNITSNKLSICTGDSTILISNTNPGSGQIKSLQWYYNGSLIPGANSANLKTKLGGNFQLEVINTNACIKTSTITSIILNPIPIGTVSKLSAGTLCEGDSTKLIATGGEKYQWLYNDTLISNATNDNFYAKKDGVYKAFVYNSAGCKNMAIDSALVNSYKKPYINFSAANACINSMINFKNISNTSLSGAVTWVWYFSNGNQSNAINASQVFSKAGTYQITLKAIPQSCPALATSVSIPIQISSPEPGIIYPSINAIINSKTQLQARNIGTKYKWLPPFYLDNINSPNPTYTGNKPMVYVVKIQNIEGCVTVDTVAVNVFQNIDILVPKAFSPNADGHNDLLDVFTIGIKDFKFFRVFNRWGQLLYETRNADQKWDGTYHGVKQPSETYVWIAEGIGIDDKIVQKRGQTILLR